LRDSQAPLLHLDAITTGYGKKQVLTSVTCDVREAEIVAVIGHNGAGKSTLFKAAIGLLPLWSGVIRLSEKVLESPTPKEMLDEGVVYVPQGQRVFSTLTILENLRIGRTNRLAHRSEGSRIENALKSFPALRDRMRQSAGTLSGGEKQLLAMSGALVLVPRILLLDEPSLGLAPLLARSTLDWIRALGLELRAGVLIIEQRVRDVLRVADRVYVIKNGTVSFAGLAKDLRDNEARLREVYL
jgi:branched-chain amino acid transport system ATP-binding protein